MANASLFPLAPRRGKFYLKQHPSGDWRLLEGDAVEHSAEVSLHQAGGPIPARTLCARCSSPITQHPAQPYCICTMPFDDGAALAYVCPTCTAIFLREGSRHL